jgi:hypothetical protein
MNKTREENSYSRLQITRKPDRIHKTCIFRCWTQCFSKERETHGMSPGIQVVTQGGNLRGEEHWGLSPQNKSCGGTLCTQVITLGNECVFKKTRMGTSRYKIHSIRNYIPSYLMKCTRKLDTAENQWTGDHRIGTVHTEAQRAKPLQNDKKQQQARAWVNMQSNTWSGNFSKQRMEGREERKLFYKCNESTNPQVQDKYTLSKRNIKKKNHTKPSTGGSHL